MKVYTLTIVYNEETEEVEYLTEELQYGTEDAITEYGEVDLKGYFDEEDNGFVEGRYIVGKA